MTRISSHNFAGMALGALVLSGLIAGCAVAPQHELRVGALKPTVAQRAVLLPTRCSSVNDECEDAYLKAAGEIIRGELEFAGYSIVDAEALVLEQRTREDASGALKVLGQKLAEAKTLAQRGSIFADLPPAQRRALMREAKAKGILSISIQLAPTDYAFAREVKTSVRYGLGEDGADLGWVSRCTHTPEALGARAMNSTKIEGTARCAIKKALDGP